MLQKPVHSPTPKRRRRIRFIAAVRFADGSRNCFTVDNASDHDHARRLVLEEVDDVAAVVIAPQR